MRNATNEAPSLALVLTYGVPIDLEDQHVEMFLKQGTWELVTEEYQECFEKLTYCKLFAQPLLSILVTKQGEGSATAP